MPVARGASSPGRGSGRALGWACRVMWCGVAVPASMPPDRTDSTVRSNGSKTSSTRRPDRPGSTWYRFPCMDTVAVLVTVRHSDQRNASARAGPAGTGNGPPASHRASGGCPVSEWART